MSKSKKKMARKKQTKTSKKPVNNNLVDDKAVIIFIKNLIPGTVKTRLAKTIGDEAAFDAYVRMQKYTRDVVKKVKAKPYLYYSQEIVDLDFWSPKKFHKMTQFGDGLGERIKHAFGYAFTFHSKIVIIGSDCVTLKKRHLTQAFDLLNKNDVVIGPSDDGGYYLFGMKAFDRDYFQGIDWSTEKVLTQTVQIAKSKNHKFAMLEQLNDIDHESDWLEVKDMLEERYPLGYQEEE